MGHVNQVQWQAYCTDPVFLRYLAACKAFDPLGIERALEADEKSGSFDFHRLIVEAYREDCATGSICARL